MKIPVEEIRPGGCYTHNNANTASLSTLLDNTYMRVQKGYWVGADNLPRHPEQVMCVCLLNGGVYYTQPGILVTPLAVVWDPVPHGDPTPLREVPGGRIVLLDDELFIVAADRRTSITSGHDFETAPLLFNLETGGFLSAPLSTPVIKQRIRKMEVVR